MNYCVRQALHIIFQCYLMSAPGMYNSKGLVVRRQGDEGSHVPFAAPLDPTAPTSVSLQRLNEVSAGTDSTGTLGGNSSIGQQHHQLAEVSRRRSRGDDLSTILAAYADDQRRADAFYQHHHNEAFIEAGENELYDSLKGDGK